MFGFDFLAQVTIWNTKVLSHITVVHHKGQEPFINVDQLRAQKAKIRQNTTLLQEIFTTLHNSRNTSDCSLTAPNHKCVHTDEEP